MPLIVRGNILQSRGRVDWLPDGNVTQPALTFVSDTDTGFYRVSNDDIAISTGGVSRLRLNSDGASITGNLATTGNVTIAGNLDVTGFITGQGLDADLSISNVQITDSSWTLLDDTALPPEGGKFIVNGSGFAPGTLVKVDGVSATATSYVNNTQLRVEVAARATGSYDLTVIRGDSKTATLPSAVSYSTIVSWVTPTSLGNVEYGQTYTIQLQATSDSNVTYSNVTTIPPDTTLSTTTGNLSGNIISVLNDTLFSFDVDAIDEELQDARRSFLLQYIGPPPILATTDQTATLLPGTWYYFMVGGGAGGGSGNNPGGSAGYIANGTFVLSTTETVTITIGQGGVGGASGTSPGANGENTSITIPGVGTYTANGATRSLSSDPYAQRGSSGGAGGEDFNQSNQSGTAGYGGSGGFGRGYDGGTTSQVSGAAAGMGTTEFTNVMNSVPYKDSYNYNFRAGTTTQRVSSTATWGGPGAAGVICDIVSYPSATSATLPYISDTPSTGFGAGGGAGAHVNPPNTQYGPGGDGAPGVVYLCPSV